MTAPAVTPAPPPHAARWLNLFIVLSLIAFFGGILAHFSMIAHPRFLTLDDAVDSQKAILERRAFVFGDEPPVDYGCWRNRVAVPLAIEGLSRATGLAFSQSYILLRFFTACAALAAFGGLVCRAVRPDLWFAGFVSAGFAFTLLPTFLHVYEIPSDFLDAACFSLLVLLAFERRRVAFAAVLLLGLTNRESAIFGTFVWFALHAWPFGRTRFLRESLYCGAVGLAGTALVFGLRLANAVSGRAQIDATLQEGNPFTLFAVHLRMLRDFFTYPTFGQPLFHLFGFATLVVLIAAAHGRKLPADWQRLGVAAVAIYLLSVSFGNIDELRIYIPSLVIFVLIFARLASQSLDRSATAPARP